MSLIVDFRNCEKETRDNLNKYQFQIGSYMVAIGMSKITSKNYKEVYARMRMFNAAILDNNEPWLDLDMCKALIGAEFNIADESKAKFSSRMMRLCIKETEAKVIENLVKEVA